MPALLSEGASQLIANEVITLAREMAAEMIGEQQRPMNRAQTVAYANIDQKDFDELIIRGGLQPVYITKTKRRYLAKDVDAAMERMKSI